MTSQYEYATTASVSASESPSMFADTMTPTRTRTRPRPWSDAGSRLPAEEAGEGGLEEEEEETEEAAALLSSPDVGTGGSSAAAHEHSSIIPTACPAGFRAHARVALYAVLAGAALGWCATSLPLPWQWRWHWQEPNRDTDTDARRYFAPPSTVIAGDDGGIGGGDDASAPSSVSAESAGGGPEKGGGDKLPGGGGAAQGRGGTLLHPQCIDGGALMEEEDLNRNRNRPLLILKYARTGSTWLVWSGNTLRLRSGDGDGDGSDEQKQKRMVWTSEVESCGDPYTDDLLAWFSEYYNPTDRDTRMRLNERGGEYGRNPKCPLTGSTYVDHVTKGLRGHERKHDRRTGLGSFVSTIDWKISVRREEEGSKGGDGDGDRGGGGNDGNLLTLLDWQTDDPYRYRGDDDDTVLGRDVPDLTLVQWERLFEAVPNLALGVLVRTNSVKRAVSRLASEEQVRLCGGKKLHGDEDCLQNLPEQLYINTTLLWDDIVLNDMKRTHLPAMVARLSTQFGDGKMVCISYESMQRDIAGELEVLSRYLGDDIDPESLDTLRHNAGKTSYKRGSDNLREYLANYDDVRTSLEHYPCLLEQLEDTGRDGKDFPPCDLWEL